MADQNPVFEDITDLFLHRFELWSWEREGGREGGKWKEIEEDVSSKLPAMSTINHFQRETDKELRKRENI